MTKFRVLFLVSLTAAISGCDYGEHPDSASYCADIGCLENIKKSAFPCVNNQDIKPYYNLLGEKINEYPTWRSAFNQLVKDYHELEQNAHKRIHKGVSIHET